MRSHTQLLPPHARLIADPEVWLEDKALEQLAQVASRPGCESAVGMPDLHPGQGIPIGAAFAFCGCIHPHLVGSDAGCGVRCVAVTKARHRGDALLRRIHHAIDSPVLPEVDRARLLTAVWSKGPHGLLSVPGVPPSLAAVAEAEPADELACSGSVPPDPVFGRQLGTIGSGNHFLELSRVAQIVDRTAAQSLGLSVGDWAVLAHSGSRRLGKWLFDQWAAQELHTPDEQQRYLADLAGVCRYARTNRLLLVWRMLVALGATNPNRLGEHLDLIHNTVVQYPQYPLPGLSTKTVWLHRKGAAPAYTDQTTIVLGSRGAPSWLMRGNGNPHALCSIAHGAGRRMSRAEAVAKLRLKYRRAELRRTAHGGHVLCDTPQLLFAEHSDAYKPIDPIISSLEQAACARRIASLLPFVTVKKD